MLKYSPVHGAVARTEKPSPRRTSYKRSVMGGCRRPLVVVQLDKGEQHGVLVRVEARGPGPARPGPARTSPVCRWRCLAVARGLVRGGTERVGISVRGAPSGRAVRMSPMVGGEVAADGFGECEDGQGVAALDRAREAGGEGTPMMNAVAAPGMTGCARADGSGGTESRRSVGGG